jgi:hypothetical protein
MGGIKRGAARTAGRGAAVSFHGLFFLPIGRQPLMRLGQIVYNVHRTMEHVWCGSSSLSRSQPIACRRAGILSGQALFERRDAARSSNTQVA